MSAIKENPILFGCLGVLGLMSLIACSGVVAMYFLADEIVETATEKMEEFGEEAGKQAGLKDPFKTVPELLSKGWALSIHVQGDKEVEFSLMPQQPEVVDCARLQSVLFPYLSGTKETVIAKSENRTVGEDGSVTTTPVECRWTGYPGSNLPPAAPAGSDMPANESGGEVVPSGAAPSGAAPADPVPDSAPATSE